MLNFGRTTFMKMNIQHPQLINISPFTKKISHFFNFNSIQMKFFTGKTETGWKFTTPTMKRKSIKPIFPPPGENLVIPSKFYIKYLSKKQIGLLKYFVKELEVTATKSQINSKT